MPRPRKVPNEVVLEAIIELVDAEVAFSSEELGKKIDLSRPTVNRRLKELDEDNLIRVSPYRDENGHRRYSVRVLAKGRKHLERYQRNSAA